MATFPIHLIILHLNFSMQSEIFEFQVIHWAIVENTLLRISKSQNLYTDHRRRSCGRNQQTHYV